MKSVELPGDASAMPLGFTCVHFWYFIDVSSTDSLINVSNVVSYSTYVQGAAGFVHTVRYESLIAGSLVLWKLRTEEGMGSSRQWQFGRTRISTHDFMSYRVLRRLSWS